MLSIHHVIDIINNIMYILDFFFIINLPKPVCVFYTQITSQFILAAFPVLSKPHDHKEKLWKDFPTAMCCIAGHFWAII